jgi:hypothetical protein
MDPNENLREQRALAEQLADGFNGDQDSAANYMNDAARLAELQQALDEWITGGGFLPNGWARTVTKPQQLEAQAPIMIPTTHLNGTGSQALMGELEVAYGAIQGAQKALQDVTVHGRDYYVQPGGMDAYRQARREMDARLDKLREVGEELLTMHRGIQAQGRR